MIAQQKEKGKSKSGKGENITLQQSRSLLTQADRHHASQLNFFRKGLKSLEAVEPHVRMVAGMQHIDYQFIRLEDDDGEGSFEDDGNEYEYEATEGGELSFNYRTNKDGAIYCPHIAKRSRGGRIKPFKCSSFNHINCRGRGGLSGRELLGVTLGPKGRNVVLHNKYGPPKIVNDGETVLKEVIAAGNESCPNCSRD